ncbi:MAG: glycerophosphodiester phosphodiesterase, partial [Rubrobacter sp.]
MGRVHTTTVRIGTIPKMVGLLVVGLAALLTAGAAPAEEARRDAPVLNIGHRGASGYAPEHTFPAYDLALEQGADYIEQDLQMTSDGVLVVLHDETLDRTARPTRESGPGDCTGSVRTKTLEQIKTCDVGRWFNEEYPGQARAEYVGLRIPTLEQVFRRYGKGTNYYIETKSPAIYPDMENELLRLMGKYDLREPAAKRWRVLIQSFDPASLQKIHARAPSLPLIQLYPQQGSPSIQATLDATRGYAVGIGPSKADVDRGLLQAAHARCLDVHPYTVDGTPQMQRFIALGVDGMFTNFPRRLEGVLGASAAEANSGAALAAEASRACRAR